MTFGNEAVSTIRAYNMNFPSPSLLSIYLSALSQLRTVSPAMYPERLLAAVHSSHTVTERWQSAVIWRSYVYYY